MKAPELSTIVVAWHAAADVAELVAGWPRDPRFELILVDQDGDLSGLLAAATAGRVNVRILAPGRNLGFAGGSNFGARAARSERLLFLNPDARPDAGPGSLDSGSTADRRASGETAAVRALEALETLSGGFDLWPRAAGLVPRLVGFDGAPQFSWQLRPLPSPWQLLAHAMFWNPAHGAQSEPDAGTPIAQPAAAALALRRNVFEEVGGFDDGFFPAWFEDVDLARRLADRGHPLLYLPSARFRHRLGSSVSELGYGGFLVAYDRNLCRYLEKHHGAGWALAFRALAGPAALARILVLPLRRPVRAASRGDAARALLAVARGTLSGWRPVATARVTDGVEHAP
ncbi:MAG: glycosyltransferase [Thermoanaerobaculia bacterium]